MNRSTSVIIHSLLIFFAVLCFFPIFVLLNNSFKDLNGILNLPLNLAWPPILENYAVVWQKMNYPQKFINSLFVASIPLPFIVLFSSMAAYGLARTKTRLSSSIFFIFTASMLVPFQAIMIPIIVMSKRMNIIDSLWGIDIIYTAFGVAFATFLYHGFIKTIPKELDEAAYIDGCTKFGIYSRIILPLLGSVTTVLVILNVLGIWNDMLLPLIFINTPERYTLPLMIFKFKGQFSMEWEKTLPAVVLVGMPIVIFFLVFQKQVTEGLANGALKG